MIKEKTHILQKCCPASSRCASQNKTGYYSVNKLRIFHLSPGHLNPRLSARVIGSKIGEVVEVVVDLVDNGQCNTRLDDSISYKLPDKSINMKLPR